jgi:hypothetical protein
MTVRVAILRAADAPAPSIVIDGCGLDLQLPRETVQELAIPLRSSAMRRYPEMVGLGVKTIVFFPVIDGVARAEFFQGAAHGPITAQSQKVCLNSLGCALVAARRWGLVDGPTVTARMGDTLFTFNIRRP